MNKQTHPIIILVLIFASLAWSASGATYYVATSGSSSGNGSLSAPWNLQTALGKSGVVLPGDTIWLRGGTYQTGASQPWSPSFAGAAGKLITWRNYNNETVKIDGHWRLGNKNYHRFWGLELYDSLKGTYSGTPPILQIDDASPPLGNEWINCVVHDVHNMWSGNTAGASVRGCIVWYAGQEVREHGVYGGLGAFSGNIVGWTSGYAVNSPSGLVTSNVLYGSGYTINSGTTEIITEAQGMVVRGNMFYEPYASGGGIRCGYSGSSGLRLTVQNNIMVGNGPFSTYGRYTSFDVSGNTVHARSNQRYAVIAKEPVTTWTWNNNRYSKQGGSVSFDDDSVIRTFASWKSAHSGLDSASTSQDNTAPADAVYVQPNQDEPKRAHVTVFNWTLKPNVQVNLAGVLSAGDTYEVRNAQDYLGRPVATGVYNGGSLLLPTTNLSVAPVLYGKGMTRPGTTGPEFAVFVVLGKSGTPSANSAPTISPIANQTVQEDTVTPPFSVTVGDAETSAGNLTLAGSSSNPTLVPNSNIALGGSGASRTVTVTPAANQSGSATITLSVSDGVLAATTSFALTVTAVNDRPTISSIPNTTVAANTATPALAFTVGDAETSAASLTVSATSSNPTLVPNANIALGGSGASRTVKVTPAANQSGSATITLSVSDGALAATSSFALTVSSVTTPPPSSTPVYLPLEAEAGTLVAPLLRRSDAAASGGAYVSSATAEAGTNTLALSVGQAGDYVLWCRIRSTNSGNDSFYVSVDGGPEDIYDTAEGAWAEAWQWTVVNGRAGGAPLSQNPRVFSLGAGSHTLRFRVRDPNTQLDQLLVTNDRNYVPKTTSNTPPTISGIPNTTVAANTATPALAFTVGDAETSAASLTVSATSSNPTLVPNANISLGGSGASRTVKVTPAANQSGSATISLSVSDGTLSATTSFTLTVNSVTTTNSRPTISSIANTTVAEDSATASLAFTVADAETSATSLTVSGASSNPTLVPNSNIALGGSGASRTVTITPAANQSGSATITLSVSDGTLSANTSFALTVTAVNDRPTISSIPNTTVAANTATPALAFTVGDAETSAASLTVSATSSNPTLVPNANIVLGGSGASRTVKVTPVANQSGSATITLSVSDGALAASSSFTLTVSAGSQGGQWYVSANATASGTGSYSNPWSLQTALNRPSTLKAGDTIWLRGGTYSGQFNSSLAGTSASPIILRNYNNERATIDGSLNLLSTVYVWFWGIEVKDSNKMSEPEIFNTIDNGGVGVRFINCMIHDCGIGLGGGTYEAYGNVMWYCGKHSTEHGIYWQNDGAVVKRIEDNLIGSVAGFGIHCYSESGNLKGFYIEGNAIWNSGILINTLKADILLGGGTPVDNATITKNFLYRTRGKGGRGLQLGYSTSANNNCVVADNYLAGAIPLIVSKSFDRLTITNNVFHSQGTVFELDQALSAGPYRIDNNRYSTEQNISLFDYLGTSRTFAQWKSATGFDPNSTAVLSTKPANSVFVRPNRYEAKRGHVIVYNWSLANNVTVDVSSVLARNDTFEVRNAQDYYGPKVLSGTYNGTALVIPMTNLSVATPVGTFTRPPATSPEFGAFVVIGTGQASGGNTAPTVSSIPNTTVAANTATPALAFTVGDAETSAASLTVSATSSNPTLVPNANIALGGSGASRTVKVTPAANQSGSATITLSVSDGALAATSSFALTVSSVTTPPPSSTPVYLPLEAEAGTLVAPLLRRSDAAASGGAYVSSATAEAGTNTLALSVGQAGDYVLWCRIRSTNSGNDSFYVSVDGGPEDIYDTTEGAWAEAWQWTAVNGRAGGAPLSQNPRVFSLGAGSHTLRFRVRDPNTQLDQLLVTNDRNYVPATPAPFGITPAGSGIDTETSEPQAPRLTMIRPGQFWISGVTNGVCQIWAATNPAASAWMLRDTVTVTNSPQLWTDTNPVLPKEYFYQVIMLP